MKLKYFLLIALLFIPSLSLAQDEMKEQSETQSKFVEEIQSQIKSLKHKWDCNTEYDRFEDNSYAHCYIELVGVGESFGKEFFGVLSKKPHAETPSFKLSFGFGFTSNKFSKDIDKFIVVVKSVNRERNFDKSTKFYAIADDERFEFGEGKLSDIDYKIDTLLGDLEISVSETLFFVLTREELQKLADAKKTEIRIGEREQELKKKQKKIISDLLILATVSEKAEKKK